MLGKGLGKLGKSGKPPISPLVEDADLNGLVRQAINSKLAEVSTVSNSVGFNIDPLRKEIIVWFNEPNSLVVDNSLAKKLETILRFALFPFYSLLPSKGIDIIDRGSEHNGSRAALRFRLHAGTFERLVFESLRSCWVLDESNAGKKLIPIEKGLSLNPTSGSGHICIAGRSGMGKTMYIITLLSQCLAWLGRGTSQNNTDSIIIIDPKADNTLYHFARHAHVKYISPRLGANTNLFFDSAKEALKTVVDEMNRRYAEQRKGKINQPHMFVVIDEAYGLVNMNTSAKALKEYHQLINTLTLQARAVNIHLVICSQTLPVGSGTDAALTSAARDQLSTRIVLSQRPTKEDCRFLMKSLDNPENILIEHDEFDVGYGLIEMPDGQIYPLKTPYIKDLSNIFTDEEAGISDD